MILGIDASNIRADGAVTHLVELIAHGDPARHGFSRVIVWSSRGTLAQLPDRPWLVKSEQPMLDRRLPWRIWWQCVRLSRIAEAAGCHVLFVPGGWFRGSFRPMVAFSQNLQPFDRVELFRFGWSWITAKLIVLRRTQLRTFRQADGLIFLTRYARDAVVRLLGETRAANAVVAHGVNERFVIAPRPQRPIEAFSAGNPMRIVYVSKLFPYKHQWHVAEAVARLRADGLPVHLDLIGPPYGPSLRRLQRTLDRVDPGGTCVTYVGSVPHERLAERYAGADLFVFASSCESFGQILLEAMAAGLPIACSARSAMPELLGDAGVYFDPEAPDDIASALRRLIASPELRAEKAAAAFDRASGYSWNRCAAETFGMVAQVARRATRPTVAAATSFR